MDKSTDELIEKYFEQKEILELKNNKKEKVDNAYLDFFTRRNTTQTKPEFNVGFLILVEIMIFTLLFTSFLFWILINIAVIIFLIITYKRNLAKWNLVNEEYQVKVNENNITLENLNKEISAIIEHDNETLKFYKRFLQNKILTGEISTFDEAKLFLLDNQTKATEVKQNYWNCDYCGSYNDIQSSRCVCCGSGIKF